MYPPGWHRHRRSGGTRIFAANYSARCAQHVGIAPRTDHEHRNALDINLSGRPGGRLGGGEGIAARVDTLEGKG